MDLTLSKLVAELCLPPAINFVLALLALALWRRAPRLAWSFALVALLGLYALSAGPLPGALARGIERFPALDLAGQEVEGAGAIVVLAGGRDSDAREYGGDTPSAMSLQRVRYGAHVQRVTQLPMLVSGGTVWGEESAESELMARVAEDEFGVPVRWRETRSRNTAENASFSAEMLGAAGIDKVILVTHALHMARSVEAFARVGLEVVPAPTAFLSGTPGAIPHGPALWGWLPDAKTLWGSRRVLHEQLGRLWYRIRY